jgi:beta-lactam-binding protein with PASTA domain
MFHRILSLVGLLVATALLVACGGGDGPVPNVVGERLDVATSELEDQGFGVEPIGGGTFGIVDESNWTVCETRPAAGETGDGDVRVIVDRTCDTASAQSEPEPEPAPTSEPEQVTESDAPDSAASAPRARKIAVPSVVGMNHQAAQNRMQDAGLFMLDEVDATGQGRVLVWDRNWVVVEQSPAPGTRVSEDRTITLSSKKIGE